jgi:hypothetical protein
MISARRHLGWRLHSDVTGRYTLAQPADNQ